MQKISVLHEKAYTKGVEAISYLSLPGLLSENQQLAINVKKRILSLLAEGPVLLEQQQLTDNEMRVFMPILESFPQSCPYEVLLSSLSSATVDSASSTLWQRRLKEAQKSRTWHQELRPLRRALSSLRGKLHFFGLAIATARERGCNLTSL